MRVNILLVDDDGMVLETIERFLAARGHGVRRASDGAEALRMMQEETPDLVISDIQMPGMDGIAFLRAIRGQFPDLPVILMTGYVTAETAIAALRNRAYDYLRKPVQIEELEACLSRIERNNHPEG
jgi:DNA-binding NtrC family response regulator